MSAGKNKNKEITGIYIINAQMRLLSPLLIASGSSEAADKEVVFYHKNNNEQLAYIPASSFTGALFNRIIEINNLLELEEKKLEIDEDILSFLSGSSDKYQSHFIPEDLLCFEKVIVTTRDGVAINDELGIAQKKAKYDYQVLEPDITFHFKAMIKVRAGIDHNKILPFLHYMNYILTQDDEFALGSNTNNGFGRFKCNELSINHFNFKEGGGTDAEAYFEYLDKLNGFTSRDESYYNHCCNHNVLDFRKRNYSLNENAFKANIRFKLKTNLIIGSNQDPETDKSTLLSRTRDKKDNTDIETPVISGKSIRGATISMMKEVMSLSKLKVDNPSFFGHNKKGDNAYVKSRLKIEEIRLKDLDVRKYTRNKIDRFTGGTIDGALFDSKPIQAGAEIEMCFRIKRPSKYEIYVLMHAIRELWVGRLTIGGEKAIGRGVLDGQGGKIKYGQNKIKFDNIKELSTQWSELNVK